MDITEIVIEADNGDEILRYPVKGDMPFLYVINRNGQRPGRFVYLCQEASNNTWTVVDVRDKCDTWNECVSHIIPVFTHCM